MKSAKLYSKGSHLHANILFQCALSKSAIP